MNDEAGVILIIAIVICYLIAEIFGRSKHIGRWWSFFLLLSGLIPGIIAIIASPSANKKPTQGGKSYSIWGWICVVFGVGNIITLIGSEGKTGQLFFAFFILSYYLFELSKGHIINKAPKYYFDNIKFNNSVFSSQPKNNSGNSRNFSSGSNDIKTNLKKLKDSGLLTQFEYLTKLKKIDDEESQNELLQSDAYLNLKHLYGAGVLDKIEFDDKVRELKNTLNRDENRLDDNNHVETTLRTVTKKKNTGLYYGIGAIVILILCLVNWDEAMYELQKFINSNSSDNQEIVTPATNTNFETVKSVEPINPTKFVYILIKIKEPKFSHIDGYSRINANLVYEVVIEDRNEVYWEEVIYTTDITEVKNFNEDAKYRFLDKAEPVIRMKLGYADSDFTNKVYGQCTETDKKASLVENHSELIDKSVFVFDSYTEASIHRENASNSPQKFSESTIKYSVNQAKAYFYNEPKEESIKKAFLVYGEIIYSSQVVNNFVYVVYTNISGKETKGWIKYSNLIEN